jgi:uncharacterized protein YqgC (DUF456 family)
MNETLAWVAGIGGLVLGGIAALVPGFPGSAVALLGLVAFAGLTDFQVLGREGLVLATLIALAGALAQILSPAIASRAAGGTAGAATGAALGAVVGTFVPIPGASLVAAVIGAVILGAIGFREGVIKAIRGVFGAAGGCFLAVAVDFVAVLGLGAVLALAAFFDRL